MAESCSKSQPYFPLEPQSDFASQRELGMTVVLNILWQKPPMESVMDQTESCVENSSGRVIKSKEGAKERSEYTEDPILPPVWRITDVSYRVHSAERKQGSGQRH